MSSISGRKVAAVAALGGVVLLLLRSMANASTPGGAAKKGGRLPVQQDPAKFMPRIRATIARHPELQRHPELLPGLIQHESKFDARAESWTGAAGLGQFTRIGRAEVRRLMGLPKWAGRYTNDVAIGAKLKAYDRAKGIEVDAGIEGAGLLLASLLAKWNDHVQAALTDYNAGGTAAKIVYDAGSVSAARPKLLALDSGVRSQSDVYAPKVLADARQFTA